MRIHWRRPRAKILVIAGMSFVISLSFLWLLQDTTDSDEHIVRTGELGVQNEEKPPEAFYDDEVVGPKDYVSIFISNFNIYINM